MWLLQYDFLSFFVQFSSVAHLCPTLCDPMDCSMPGLPVLHHLPEPGQTHVHHIGDAIQPSHPLSSKSINSLALSFLHSPTLTTLHDYWKNHSSLTIWTFASKVMSLLFNTLFWFVIALLPRSKHILILCLQSTSTVILEPKKIKSITVFIFSPSICNEVMGLDTMIFAFWMLRDRKSVV